MIYLFWLIGFFANCSTVFSLEHDPNYDAIIRNCEYGILVNCRVEMPFTDRQNITQGLSDKVRNNQNFLPADAGNADWTNANLSQMVSGLLWIQDKKLSLRYPVIPNSTYNPGFNFNLEQTAVAERAVDPYPINFTLGNETHTLISNYNGVALQPGNCRLRRTHVGGALSSNVIVYTPYNNPITVDLYRMQPYKLLSAIEISRRKAFTPAGVPDAFHHIPVSLGVVIATKLIDSDQQNLARFWLNNGAYHIFTSPQAHPEQRMNRFNALINVYRQGEGIANDLEAVIGQIRTDSRRILDYQDDFIGDFENLQVN